MNLSLVMSRETHSAGPTHESLAIQVPMLDMTLPVLGVALKLALDEAFNNSGMNDDQRWEFCFLRLLNHHHAWVLMLQ